MVIQTRPSRLWTDLEWFAEKYSPFYSVPVFPPLSAGLLIKILAFYENISSNFGKTLAYWPGVT